jgi:hypothetical protein
MFDKLIPLVPRSKTGSVVVVCWNFGFESRRLHGCMSCMNVVRYRPLRRTDPSSRGVLMSVV